MKHARRHPLTSVLSALLALSAWAAAEAANPEATWPQWRGPGRDSQVTGGPQWPDKLQGDHLQQLWRVELGQGYPGPIVAADRVFVAETVDRKYERVRALDRTTGRELWQFQWEGSLSVPFFAKRNGDWIRSTPAYDGESLYVAGMRDVLVCIDAQTGKQRWRVDFVERFKSPVPAFGFVCSPLVDGDDLYVQAGAAVVKLNKKTGETIWRTMDDGGGMWGSAFSSPILATLEGQRQLLVQTRTKLAGVEPGSGKVLWSKEIPAFRGMNILTPTVFDDAVFTSSYKGQSVLLRLEKSAAGIGAREAWTNKAQAYMASPVVIDGHAYFLRLGRTDKQQPLTCVDLKTGEIKWTSERNFGEYASLVAQKNRILALDNRGVLTLIRASPQKFEMLDERKVSDEETWGHLAVCGDEVFVRELKGIAAYRWR